MRRDSTLGAIKVVVSLLAAAISLAVIAPTRALADGQAIVNAAASQAGVPYCWDGGNEYGPTHGGGGSGCGGSTVGFDCTGLAIYALYHGAGVSGLPHDGEGDRWSAKGTRINDQSQLQPGDIVFFGGSFSSFDHAAIYAGGGMTWDADNFNVPVQQHSLAWIEHALPFVGAVRFAGSGGGGSSELPDGSFVSNHGFVYRIAGGAPIYVSNWNAVGGPQPTTALSDADFAALSQYPHDGALISSTATGMVYEVAGGAPLYVSNWNAIGGPRPAVGVDQAAIDSVGGGAPWNHLRATPADGTLISSTATGMVYEIAGGAPLYVSNWNAIGGPRPAVGIDQWDIDNSANPAAHLRAYPADGTLVASTATGMVYEIAGGAPLYVSNWSAIGGARPAVGVDQAAIDNIGGGAPWNHLRAIPADGTLVSSTATGMVYEIAGGAPIYVSKWSIFGGVQTHVNVDQWDVDHPENPAAHLDARPSDGTVVEGLPSHSFWLFNSGYRNTMSSNPAAVAVDDAGLAAFPPAPQNRREPTNGGGPGGANGGGTGGAARCVVPALVGHRLTAANRLLRRAGCETSFRVRRRQRCWIVRRQTPEPGVSVSAHHTIRVRLSRRAC